MTDQEIEKAAEEYVLKRQVAKHNAKDEYEATMADFDRSRQTWDAFDMEQSFRQGAHFALSHQWVSVEERLPEEKKVVLCYIPDMKDNYAEKDAYFDITILLDGVFINLDAETIYPSHWMPIPPPNPEKE